MEVCAQFTHGKAPHEAANASFVETLWTVPLPKSKVAIRPTNAFAQVSASETKPLGERIADSALRALCNRPDWIHRNLQVTARSCTPHQISSRQVS